MSITIKNLKCKPKNIKYLYPSCVCDDIECYIDARLHYKIFRDLNLPIDDEDTFIPLINFSEFLDTVYHPYFQEQGYEITIKDYATGLLPVVPFINDYFHKTKYDIQAKPYKNIRTIKFVNLRKKQKYLECLLWVLKNQFNNAVELYDTYTFNKKNLITIHDDPNVNNPEHMAIIHTVVRFTDAVKPFMAQQLMNLELKIRGTDELLFKIINELKRRQFKAIDQATKQLVPFDIIHEILSFT